MAMRFWIIALVSTASYSVFAWDNHALLTRFAIRNLPEIANAGTVKVESLESFVAAEPVALTRILAEHEEWSKKNVAYYPTLPVRFAFTFKDGTGGDLKHRFLQAIRVNPQTKFALALQQVPGQKPQKQMPRESVTLMPNTLSKGCLFVEVKPGEDVSAVEVFASATDEPDFGLDIKLWSDNGTTFGRAYNFGEQPFGNNKLEYGSQAPFHMAILHEGRIVDWVAGERLRTFAEYRIHLFYALARVAFQTGHSYWGWRFAGMGAHYVQDLTQPYHTKAMPGESASAFLWAGLLNELGFSETKSYYVERNVKEHAAIEKLAFDVARKALESGVETSPLVQALGQAAQETETYSGPYVRKVLTAYSFQMADPIAEQLRIDPSSPSAQVLMKQLMAHFGKHTRAYVRSILAQRISQK